jgi:hypothetical protein
MVLCPDFIIGHVWVEVLGPHLSAAHSHAHQPRVAGRGAADHVQMVLPRLLPVLGCHNDSDPIEALPHVECEGVCAEKLAPRYVNFPSSFTRDRDRVIGLTMLTQIHGMSLC